MYVFLLTAHPRTIIFTGCPLIITLSMRKVPLESTRRRLCWPLPWSIHQPEACVFETGLLFAAGRVDLHVEGRCDGSRAARLGGGVEDTRHVVGYLDCERARVC